jgi:hypothetical protein
MGRLLSSVTVPLTIKPCANKWVCRARLAKSIRWVKNFFIGMDFV